MLLAGHPWLEFLSTDEKPIEKYWCNMHLTECNHLRWRARSRGDGDIEARKGVPPKASCNSF